MEKHPCSEISSESLTLIPNVNPFSENKVNFQKIINSSNYKEVR
jgi:hypothetical protein